MAPVCMRRTVGRRARSECHSRREAVKEGWLTKPHTRRCCQRWAVWCMLGSPACARVEQHLQPPPLKSLLRREGTHPAPLPGPRVSDRTPSQHTGGPLGPSDRAEWGGTPLWGSGCMAQASVVVITGRLPPAGHARPRLARPACSAPPACGLPSPALPCALRLTVSLASYQLPSRCMPSDPAPPPPPLLTGAPFRVGLAPSLPPSLN